ncbi:Mitochondrial mRNA pseudouridine synthase RPUSD3 [Nymphon striatum]|nr:Mitochondrial mRNA pseudouridine synthase RPUSD3 [Nymphon striatum]
MRKSTFNTYLCIRTLNKSLATSTSGTTTFGKSNRWIDRQPDFNAQKHEYKNLFSWKSKEEFSDSLYKSIIYNAGGLIALNKPYGVPAVTHSDNDSENKKIKQTLSDMWIGESPYAISDSLDILAEKLEVQKLRIIKCAERYSSGVTLLATSDEVKNKVAICIRSSHSLNICSQQYWLICCGIPFPKEEKKKVGIELMEVAKGDIQPIIQQKCSKSSVKLKQIKPVLYDYRCIASNNALKTSLLQISVSKNKSHFVRALAADKAVILIGDHMFACRVKSILGKYVAVSPTQVVNRDTIHLDPTILHKLGLSSETQKGIPSQLHLHGFTLVNYNGTNKHLHLKAPPPQHFLWTCHQLGLLPPSIETAAVVSGEAGQTFHTKN